jgi:hypothetical protein
LIATIIVLEYSFFSFQKGGQKSAKIADLVVSEYIASQIPFAITNAIEEFLHHSHDEDGVDEHLGKMIIHTIFQERMCESPMTC